jgi:hypothetical protein
MSKQPTSVKAISKASARNVVSLILLLLLVSGGVIGARALTATPTETVSVVLGQQCFTPESVTSAAGQVRLEVANQSGAPHVTYQLRRDGGGLVQEWKVESAAQTLSEMVELTQGGYVLMVAENPACLFHITVQ